MINPNPESQITKYSPHKTSPKLRFACKQCLEKTVPKNGGGKMVMNHSWDRIRN